MIIKVRILIIIIDEQVDSMIDIADAEIDVLVVWLDMTSLKNTNNDKSSDFEDGKSSISKHDNWVVIRVCSIFVDNDVFDDDKVEWYGNESSVEWHVSKQCGRWP